MFGTINRPPNLGVRTHQHTVDTVYERFPYKLENVIHDQEFAGKRAFIIGGGPSVEGFDYSVLDGEITIGINKSGLEFKNSTIWYAMDYNLIGLILSGRLGEICKRRWDDYQGLKTFLVPFSAVKPIVGEPIYAIRRWAKPFRKFSFRLSDGLYGGNNSGYGALELAVCMGCNPIYLLGFDMRTKLVGGVERTHSHDGYPYLWGGDYESKLKDFKIRTQGYIDEFRRVSIFLQNAGIQVYNLCQDSALDCFDFERLEDILHVAVRE